MSIITFVANVTTAFATTVVAIVAVSTCFLVVLIHITLLISLRQFLFVVMLLSICDN